MRNIKLFLCDRCNHWWAVAKWTATCCGQWQSNCVVHCLLHCIVYFLHCNCVLSTSCCTVLCIFYIAFVCRAPPVALYCACFALYLCVVHCLLHCIVHFCTAFVSVVNFMLHCIVHFLHCFCLSCSTCCVVLCFFCTAFVCCALPATLYCAFFALHLCVVQDVMFGFLCSSSQ